MPSETEFIRRLKDSRSLGAVGDDCAVLPKDSTHDTLITADMLVENVDFRLDWTTPEALGHKSLAVSLSDVAAMGGTPVWGMVSLAMPKEMWRTDLAERFYEGWFKLAGKHDVELIGGDVSSASVLVIDSIVGGEVRKGTAVLRSGASPGDLIYVTGTLGGAAAGLRLLESPEPGSEDHRAVELIQRQLRPAPQVEVGRSLNKLLAASAMIDVSDGLSTDLGHLCDASRVGATINAASIPVDPNMATNLSLSKEAALELALNGGEDLELLFTAREPVDVPNATRIGRIDAECGLRLCASDGSTRELPRKGFQHF